MEDQPRLQIGSTAEVRGTDNHGSGHYGAPRGKRKHRGIDFVCVGGTYILSPIDGILTRIKGIVYSDRNKQEYNYVEVTDSNGVHCRCMYVEKWGITKGQQVKRGDILGVAEGIEFLYEGITPHIHFEVRIDRKTYLNPLEYLRGVENELDR